MQNGKHKTAYRVRNVIGTFEKRAKQVDPGMSAEGLNLTRSVSTKSSLQCWITFTFK